MPLARLKIAETFNSIQGEGEFTGVRSTFIRTTGCNLRCWFCDTPYTSWEPEGVWRTVDDLCREAREWDTQHVVITGGEPFLQPALVELTTRLAAAGHVITIETAGTVVRPVAAQLMSISPKLQNSTPDGPRPWARRHEERRFNLESLTELTSRYRYQLKFVIDTPEDLADVTAWLERVPHIEPDRVYLMPQGIEQAQLEAREVWLRPLAAAHGFRYCPRVHIALFGNTRGT